MSFFCLYPNTGTMHSEGHANIMMSYIQHMDLDYKTTSRSPNQLFFIMEVICVQDVFIFEWNTDPILQMKCDLFLLRSIWWPIKFSLLWDTLWGRTSISHVGSHQVNPSSPTVLHLTHLSWDKWLPLCGWHFQTHCLVCKFLHIDSYFTEVCSKRW